MSWDRAKRIAELPRLTKKRILTLDGAMGTMIQRHKPDEVIIVEAAFLNLWTSKVITIFCL